MEIPADVSPPACYILHKRSCCTNFQACLFLEGKTMDIAGASRTFKLPSPGGNYQMVVPFGCGSWVPCQGPATQQTQRQAESTKCVSVFSLRLHHTQVKRICDKLSMIWLSYPLCSRLQQASAQEHTLHLCHTWVLEESATCGTAEMFSSFSVLFCVYI